MADTQMMERLDRTLVGSDAIRDFAARVLDALVSRCRRSAMPLRHDLVVALSEGLVTQDEALIDRTLAEFRRGCITPAAMADLYVPAAARYLGVQWCSDQMSFAEVTIATARLQALVRAICTRWGTDLSRSSGPPSVLMVVPPGEDHTLGAVVATGQLRRMGVAVCLRLHPQPGEVAELLRSRTFDAAMISVAQPDRLDACRRLVGVMRRHGGPALPVVVGGAIVQSGKDVRNQIGADLVSADAGDALRFCGLVPPREPDARQADLTAQLQG